MRCGGGLGEYAPFGLNKGQPLFLVEGILGNPRPPGTQDDGDVMVVTKQ
jgi:hypothetical protein